jgi:hypothetical protein
VADSFQGYELRRTVGVVRFFCSTDAVIVENMAKVISQTAA